jgi:hypothetical protein
MPNAPFSWLTIALLSLGLVGCPAANGPLYNAAALPPPAADTVRIVVFRQPAPGGFGAGVEIPVKLDGQDFAELPQLSYVSRDVPAGSHELTAARSALTFPGRARLVLTMDPGATAFVEVSHSGAAMASAFVPIASVTATDSEQGGAYRLQLTDPTRALSLLSKCRRAD